MRKTAIIFISAAVLLAGCSKKTEEAPLANAQLGNAVENGVPPVEPAVSPDQAFVNAAASSDAFEIETSKLALATSGSASVKKFAQMMVDAHTASTAKLKAAAAKAQPALLPDPTLAPDQQAKIDALKMAKGEEFDRAYITAQNEGHAQTLDKLKSYASGGGQPALKDFATAIVPVVTAHLNAVRALKP